MGAQIREYRQRIRSVSATKKITRAMELMAASRVVKAQQAVRESTPMPTRPDPHITWRTTKNGVSWEMIRENGVRRDMR